MSALKIKDDQGNWINLPGLKGDKGDKGDKGESGVYLGTATPSDEDINVWINPNGEPHTEAVVVDPTLTMEGQAADAKAVGDEIKEANEHLSEIEDKLYEKVRYDFSQNGNESYPYGWRTGYYNTSSTGGTSSATYARTRINNISLNGINRLQFTPPHGYASSLLFLYTEDGETKYDHVGSSDSTSAEGSAYIDYVHDIDCSKYEAVGITVGKFTNTGGSTDFVQDAEWVNSIILILYRFKDNSNRFDNIENYIGLSSFDLQDGYYNSSSVGRKASTRSMSTKKIQISGDKFAVQCKGYSVGIYWFKSDNSPAFIYENNLTGDYLREVTVPESANYVAINIIASIDLTDAIREDIKKQLFVWQYTENEFRFANKARDVRITTLNSGINSLFPSFSKNANLKLLHFSDPHTYGNDRNIPRIIEYFNNCEISLDDILSTGDNIHEYYSEGYGAFTDNAGAEKILTVIGNHDVADSSIGSHYITGVTEEDLCDKFLFGINTWDAVHQTGKTYWYKDYDGIRLIGINSSWDSTLADLNSYPDRKAMIESAEQAQLTWLESVLSDARINSKAVVIATHFSLKNAVPLECTFSSGEYALGSVAGKSLSENIQEKAQAFIDGGGEFIAFISGHAHFDTIVYNSNYPDQVDICVTSANYTLGDLPREYATKSQDAFNLVSFNKTDKLIKIIRIGADRDNHLRLRKSVCIDYATKAVLSNN